ncbi:hypothetical protein CAQU_02320 [Corynebacterium aquilae DSM 44791]|uniref:Uncharacterized protein n=2 Tax=Corynebacterium aquilae TaxID=203263 RepID=A0A1L7CE45_9CORY|nr:hypothetical protein CAQU_02320 [Corynebacterium aquilae DSM 44791]
MDYTEDGGACIGNGSAGFGPAEVWEDRENRFSVYANGYARFLDSDNLGCKTMRWPAVTPITSAALKEIYGEPARVADGGSTQFYHLDDAEQPWLQVTFDGNGQLRTVSLAAPPAGAATPSAPNHGSTSGLRVVTSDPVPSSGWWAWETNGASTYGDYAFFHSMPKGDGSGYLEARNVFTKQKLWIPMPNTSPWENDGLRKALDLYGQPALRRGDRYWWPTSTPGVVLLVVFSGGSWKHQYIVNSVGDEAQSQAISDAYGWALTWDGFGPFRFGEGPDKWKALGAKYRGAFSFSGSNPVDIYEKDGVYGSFRNGRLVALTIQPLFLRKISLMGTSADITSSEQELLRNFPQGSVFFSGADGEQHFITPGPHGRFLGVATGSHMVRVGSEEYAKFYETYE